MQEGRDFTMKLRISNFARIKKAEIEIDGITVITGYNNTGKSTIGKIVFSLFNSLFNIEKKVDKQRRNEIQELCLPNIRNYIEHTTDIQKNAGLANSRRLSYEIATDISNAIINSIEKSLDYENLSQITYKIFESYDVPIKKDSIIELIDVLADKVSSIAKLSDDLVMCEIISRYFGKIFSGQMNCLNKEKSEARLELIIKNKKISTLFKNNECIKYEPTYNILHEAFYIDNPFIIDELLQSYYYGDANHIKNHILTKFLDNNSIMDSIFDAVIAKEKLESIYKVMDKVIEGNIVVNRGIFGLDTKDFSEPIKLANLSTGLKSFVIIKMLLEKGILKEKDVLILDEPEIHLHPEWQLIYAEIIVLLQKTFDLSIIVTTHSYNFLESIDYFSRSHSIKSKCKYYLAASVDEINTFEDVTDNIDKIYAQMIQPSVLLDKLKYEMENDENE